MWEYGIGIPDEAFIRGNVPMTKQEVRAVSISKMKLRRDSIVWDIGAGTGAVSVEIGLYAYMGKIYAIEEKEEAADLIMENKKQFGVNNLKCLLGKAPEALENLDRPDRIFIGGTGKNTLEILDVCVDKIKEDGVIVLNCITLDTVFNSMQYLENKGFNCQIVCINIARSKKAGDKTMMLAQNPVYILQAEVKK